MNNTEKIFIESIELKQKMLSNDLLSPINDMGSAAANAIMKGGKIMLCGNGGSAADAQHLAAELLVRLRPRNNRQGVPAISLAQDTSTITACGNDFGYDLIYERMVQALGRKGDVLIGISTSGNSENVILAMKKAKSMGVTVFGFLGEKINNAKDFCDYVLVVPSNDTGRIQEIHITAGHALMERVEDILLESKFLKLDKS